MNNSWRSIKIMMKISFYDFFMMILSLMIKFSGPLLYTYSIANLFGEFSNILTGKEVSVKYILIFAIALFIASFYNLFYSRFFSTFVSMPRCERRLKRQIHKKISKVSSEILIDPLSDIIVQRAVFAGTNIFRLVQTTLELFFTILSGLSLVFVLANIHIYLGIGLILSILPTIFSIVYETQIKIKNKDLKLEINRVKNKNKKSITGQPQFAESRTNFADEFFIKKYKENTKKFNGILKEESSSIFKKDLLLFPFSVFSDASDIIISTILLGLKKISFSGFGGGIAAYQNIKNQIFSIFSLLEYGRQFDSMVEPYFDFMTMEERRGKDETTEGVIKFQNVSFTYPKAKEKAVKNINLEIHPQEK